MIKIAASDISKLYLGSTECVRAFQGAEIIYGEEPYITFTSSEDNYLNHVEI